MSYPDYFGGGLASRYEDWWVFKGVALYVPATHIGTTPYEGSDIEFTGGDGIATTTRLEKDDFSWSIVADTDGYNGYAWVRGLHTFPANTYALWDNTADEGQQQSYYVPLGPWTVEIFWEQTTTYAPLDGIIPVVHRLEQFNVHLLTYGTMEDISAEGGIIQEYSFYHNGNTGKGSYLVTDGVTSYWNNKARGFTQQGSVTRMFGDWSGGATTNNYNTHYQGVGSVEMYTAEGDAKNGVLLHHAPPATVWTHHKQPVAYWHFSKLGSQEPIGKKPPPKYILSCFTEKTKIAMIGGDEKSIKDVKAGDKVLTLDTFDKSIIESTVTKKFEHPKTPGFTVINNNLEVTHNHEMYDGDMWRPVSEYSEGDYIYFIDGTKKKIESLEHVDDEVTTYNIEVDSDEHNYFANGYTAHNKTIIYTPPPPPQQYPPPETSCFLKGTKITLSDGSEKLIENINCGDKVLSYDTKNKAHVESTITNVTCHPKTKSYLIVNKGDLRATSNHEMYNGTEWLPLDRFKVGDTIQNINGKLIKINSIENRNIESTTFDLTVDSEHHNYYANEFLAHNKTIILQPPPTPPTPPTTPWPPPPPTFPPQPPTPPPPSCFTGDTLIAMGDGTKKKIRDIRVGDIVRVCDTDTNELIESKVNKFTCHYDVDEYICINNELNVTPNHPLYNGSEWKEAKDFLLFDDIQYIDGTYKNVSSIDKVYEKVAVYNFCVESEHHNYYANGYLAHNSKTVTPPPGGTGNPFKVSPCTPAGSPSPGALMMACTACGTAIKSTPTYAGATGAGGIVYDIARCNFTNINFLYNGTFRPHTVDPSPLIHRGTPIGSSIFENVTGSHMALSCTVTLPMTGMIQNPAIPTSFRESERHYFEKGIGWYNARVHFYVGLDKDGFPCTLSECRYQHREEHSGSQYSHGYDSQRGANVPGIMHHAISHPNGLNASVYGTARKHALSAEGWIYLSLDNVNLHSLHPSKHPGEMFEVLSGGHNFDPDAHKIRRWMFHLQKRLGYIQYNIYTRAFRDVQWTQDTPYDVYHQGEPVGGLKSYPYQIPFEVRPDGFTANKAVQGGGTVNYTAYSHLRRALTAVSIVGNEETRCYIPSNFYGQPLSPLLMQHGACSHSGVSALTKYEARSSNHPANRNDICFTLEWKKPDSSVINWVPSLSSTYRGYPIVGGLNPPPLYYTANSMVPLASAGGDTLQRRGNIATRGTQLTRPRTKAPLAGGTALLSHHDHHPRKYNLFGGIRVKDLRGREYSIEIPGSTDLPWLSGNVFSMTSNIYYCTQNPSVTASRIRFEFDQSSEWDIADFKYFTTGAGSGAAAIGLSGHEIASYAQFIGAMTALEPLTASHPYIQALGFCTYNGSLTASDGSFYFAAIARCNKPAWVESADQIGLYGKSVGDSKVDNFVICTSGKELVLPYLCYRAASAAG